MYRVSRSCVSPRRIHIRYASIALFCELEAPTTAHVHTPSHTVFQNTAGFLQVEMEIPQVDLSSEVVEVMEVPTTAEMKKKISILDTKLAIRPFKTSPEGLEAFVQACHRKKTGGSTPEMFGIHFKRVVNNKALNPPQIDHLFFLKYYEIVLKCKQERSVST